ncbi:MAG: hypothetical protein SWN10_23790 [Pseudomonadota bacterium]|nr:hypothetical protein [Pseudomonadota bacterium]
MKPDGDTGWSHFDPVVATKDGDPELQMVPLAPGREKSLHRVQGDLFVLHDGDLDSTPDSLVFRAETALSAGSYRAITADDPETMVLVAHANGAKPYAPMTPHMPDAEITIRRHLVGDGSELAAMFSQRYPNFGALGAGETHDGNYPGENSASLVMCQVASEMAKERLEPFSANFSASQMWEQRRKQYGYIDGQIPSEGQREIEAGMYQATDQHHYEYVLVNSKGLEANETNTMLKRITDFFPEFRSPAERASDTAKQQMSAAFMDAVELAQSEDEGPRLG